MALLAPKVVVLYDKDYLKKFRVYFSQPKQPIQFEHGMRNYTRVDGVRERIMPDFVHITTIAPANYDGSNPVLGVMLDGSASQADGAGILGYDVKYLWLLNPNTSWPGGANPGYLVAEVLCRWFHSHERSGDHIDNVDESHERPIIT